MSLYLKTYGLLIIRHAGTEKQVAFGEYLSHNGAL